MTQTRTAATAALLCSLALPAWAQDPNAEPENFAACLEEIEQRAAAAGVSEATREQVMPKLAWRPDVIALDRRQPEFTSSFARYFNRAVSERRIERGRELFAEHRDRLWELQQRYGVPGRYIVAFWGLETNFGSYLGDTPSLDALATLACDTRRSGYFRGELLAALQLLDEQGLGQQALRGSWAGALGLVQFMPSNYRRYGRDGDGDGRVDLFNSVPDALESAAHFLAELGWNTDQRWGREITLPPGFDYALGDGRTMRPLREWARLGLRHASGAPLPVADFEAALLVPAGADGPAFLVYPNFRVIKRWNNSDFYALAVGHLADRIVGGGALERIAAEPPERMRLATVKAVQERLNALGYEAGEVDGILGGGTRAALRAFQADRDLVADGHLDGEVLEALEIDPAAVVPPPTPTPEHADGASR